MANNALTISSPYWPRPARAESVASNSARPVVTPDGGRHAEQRALLKLIEQFVDLSDYVQNYVDSYWDLDQVSAKFIRDPLNADFSEYISKLDLTVRGLGQVSSALVKGLGHQPEDEERVKEYLGQLRQLYAEAMGLVADNQAAAGNTKVTNIMGIRTPANLARGRAIAVVRDVNSATQRRLALLNQFFPEDMEKLGTDPIAQPSTILPAPGDASTQSGGSFQVPNQQLTRGTTNDF